jgi:DNA-binding NtrC family response regulator
VTVLVLGESGTGKELVARALYQHSKRADKPFVAVNAGGLAEGVFESELFGHVRGAFTDARADRAGCFELADGGTLFLDEIANMPLSQQAKLLRVLQTGEFHPVGSSRVRRADVRVLAATNVDVGREVAEGRFREDLLYRLNTVELRLPPLRERREDLAALAARFLVTQGARYGRRATLAPDAMTALAEHAWPGNVRELEHVIERALLLAPGDVIHAADLQLGSRGTGEPRLDDLTLDEAERLLIHRALARHGEAADAARALGLSRSAFYRRLQHHGIKRSP